MIFLLLSFHLLLFSCSSPKKTVNSVPAGTRVTPADRLKGGTSFDDAIVIRVKTEKAGIQEEFRWLRESYPGYALIRKSRVSHGGRQFDLIWFRTRAGVEKTAYFDVTGFFGK